MGPKPQKGSTPVDKLVWKWAESVGPDEMTSRHVTEAYRLNLKACNHSTNKRNCRGNPRCLIGLGERGWFQDILETYWYQGPDPTDETRKKDERCGLRNFGATCYVNTLLQVWFNNPELRHAVYRYKDDDVEPDQTGEYNPKSVCGQLQLIFALMQKSVRKFVDPLSLITSLGLDTMQQQDAQEFSKLFMALLGNALSKQPDEMVRNVVKEQFCGEYKYATKCKTCGFVSERPAEFCELDLNVKGNKDLHSCIREFLKEEKLEGENQYACQQCACKRDATRRILLTHLPRTLNCQLLRFVYDRSSQQKKKLNSSVQFPEELDMSQYISGDGDHSYELSAVLIHRGTTAYSGHYIAHIRHKIQGQGDVWYKYNDELVEKMKGSKLQLGNEEELYQPTTTSTNGDESGEPSAKKARVSKGYHTSANAYMLVYRLNSRASSPVADDVIPDHVMRAVEQDNSKFDAWCSEHDDKKAAAVKLGNEKQMSIQRTYTRLADIPKTDDGVTNFNTNTNANSSDEPLVVESGTKRTEFMSAEWLSAYFTEPDDCKEIDHKQFLCKHGRLDVDKVGQMKLVNSEMSGELFASYGGGPRIYSDDLCRECVKSRCRLVRLKCRVTSDQPLVNQLLKQETNSGGYWVGKQSLRQWKTLALQVIEEEEKAGNHSGGGDASCDVIAANDDVTERAFFNEDILCEEHGNLSVDTSCRRPVSKHLWSLLKFYFPKAPEFGTDHGVCKQCQAEALAVADERSRHRVLAAQFRDLLPDLYANRKRPRYDVIITDDVIKVQDVHKMTSLPPSIVMTPSSEVKTEVENELTLKNGIITSESDVKTDVKTMLDSDVKSDNVTSDSAVTLRDEVTSYHVVSADGLEEWRKFVKLQGRTDLPLLPGNEWLLCQHEKLGQPLATYMNSYSSEVPRASLLHAGEWEILSSLLPFPPSQPVCLSLKTCATGKAFYSVQPDTCPECRKQSSSLSKPQSFSNTTIYIHRTSNGNDNQAVTDESEPSSTSPANQIAVSDQPIRRSYRHRRGKEDMEVKVDSTDTVRELKVKLLPRLEVAPFDQHLFLRGRELRDDVTLADAGVTPGAVVHIKVDEPDEKNNVFWPQDAQALSGCPEVGFEGTGLHGGL